MKENQSAGTGLQEKGCLKQPTQVRGCCSIWMLFQKVGEELG